MGQSQVKECNYVMCNMTAWLQNSTSKYIHYMAIVMTRSCPSRIIVAFVSLHGRHSIAPQIWTMQQMSRLRSIKSDGWLEVWKKMRSNVIDLDCNQRVWKEALHTPLSINPSLHHCCNRTTWCNTMHCDKNLECLVNEHVTNNHEGWVNGGLKRV